MVFTFKYLFTPHRTNNHRARILQPAGLSVLIGLFLLSQSSLQLLRYAPALPDGFVLGYASNITASTVVDSTNVERSKAGLSSLSYSSTLSEAAARKASHMFSNNYWAHVAPDGSTPWNFIVESGYSYTVAGENLARDFDSTDPMIGAWMSSPTHKENIVNEKYTEIGVAVVDGTLQGVETTLVVQMFGTPTGAQASIPPPEIPQEAASNIRGQEAVLADSGSKPADALLLEEQVEEELQEDAPALSPEAELAAAEVLRFDDALGVTLDTRRDSVLTTTYLSPMMLTKAVATSIMILIIGVLLYDTYIIHRKKIPRFVGKNWAHLTFFSLVIILILGLTQGKVM